MDRLPQIGETVWDPLPNEVATITKVRGKLVETNLHVGLIQIEPAPEGEEWDWEIIPKA